METLEHQISTSAFVDVFNNDILFDSNRSGFEEGSDKELLELFIQSSSVEQYFLEINKLGFIEDKQQEEVIFGNFYDPVASYLDSIVNYKSSIINFLETDFDGGEYELCFSIFLIVYMLKVRSKFWLVDGIFAWLHWKHDFTLPKLQFWLVQIVWINKLDDSSISLSLQCEQFEFIVCFKFAV